LGGGDFCFDGRVSGADGERNFECRLSPIEDRSEPFLAFDEKFASAFAKAMLGEKMLVYAIISASGGGDI
jgi:hypothetical protein